MACQDRGTPDSLSAILKPRSGRLQRWPATTASISRRWLARFTSRRRTRAASLTFVAEGPNAVSAAVVAEGGRFLVSGGTGHFSSSAELVEAAATQWVGSPPTSIDRTSERLLFLRKGRELQSDCSKFTTIGPPLCRQVW